MQPGAGYQSMPAQRGGQRVDQRFPLLDPYDRSTYSVNQYSDGSSGAGLAVSRVTNDWINEQRISSTLQPFNMVGEGGNGIYHGQAFGSFDCRIQPGLHTATHNENPYSSQIQHCAEGFLPSFHDANDPIHCRFLSRLSVRGYYHPSDHMRGASGNTTRDYSSNIPESSPPTYVTSAVPVQYRPAPQLPPAVGPLVPIHNYHYIHSRSRVPPPPPPPPPPLPDSQLFRVPRHRPIPPPPLQSFPPQNTVPRFYCRPCDKGFASQERYKEHVDESHLPCDHPGCSYSAPPHILEAHQLQHIQGQDGRNEAVDCFAKEEFSDEREHKAKEKDRRHITGAVCDNDRNLNTCSALEKMLRSRFCTAIGQSSLRRRIGEASAFLPELRAVLKRRRISRLQSNRPLLIPEAKRRRRCGQRDFTDAELARDFPICEHFLKFKTCKWNPCHFSHDIGAYRRWKIQQNARGFDIPMRPPLLYQLLLPDIKKSESRVLEALRYLVQQNFFRDTQDEDDFVLRDPLALPSAENPDVVTVLSSCESFSSIESASECDSGDEATVCSRND